MSKKVRPYTNGGMSPPYRPSTKEKGQIGRRDRKKCKYYRKETKWCQALWCDCVGPTICRKYKEE